MQASQQGTTGGRAETHCLMPRAQAGGDTGGGWNSAPGVQELTRQGVKETGTQRSYLEESVPLKKILIHQRSVLLHGSFHVQFYPSPPFILSFTACSSFPGTRTLREGEGRPTETTKGPNALGLSSRMPAPSLAPQQAHTFQSAPSLRL